MKTGLLTVQWIEITYVANNINSPQKVRITSMHNKQVTGGIGYYK